MEKNIVISVMLLACVAAAAELSEAEVDRLCPPRAETAAEFKAGTYPPAARPYREVALKAFAYMASLPAMRTLVEKGEPEQTYQHNAYVSKTHAAHINLMLEWARREPARRKEALRLAKASAEYLLTELEPKDAPLAWWPPTYGRKPLRRDPDDGGKNRPSMVGNEPEGAVKYRGEVMLLYPADVGAAFVAYYRETHDRRFLDAARGIGETYLKTRRSDGSWPLKMRLATGEPIGENTLVPTKPLAFFNALAEATGDDRWAKASDACFAWLEAHPLTDWNWDGQFEDIQPRPPYANPTKHNAVDAMFEILRRFPGDKARLEQCRRILRFCEKRFVCWEKPANHPKWDVPSVLEQYSCFVPIDASAAKMIRAYLALWRVTGEPELLAKARTLGDTITRVQTPEGRIPTFWMHDTLGQPIYDWLNCMGSSAAALLELDDANNSFPAMAGDEAGRFHLPPERVAKIKAYLAAQKCPMPEIDGDNYGNREGVPTGPFYYGFTLDPLEKLKGFKKIGHLPCRDARDTSSTFFSAGLEMGNMLGEKIVPYLAAAGFKRARLNYAWRKMEKEKGVYDFAEADQMVDALRAAGIQPWFYGGYGNELYYGKVEVQNKLSSSFWDAPCYHGPEAVEVWNNFIRALARHFKGRVELYEIWNELDARWYKDGLNAHKTIGVAQAARDFTAFYKRTMEIIKEVDPKARGTISLGSLLSGWNIGLAQAGLPEVLDMWTYHGYLRAPEEDVRMSLDQVRTLFRRADGSLPEIAMGECGRGAGPALTARVSTRTEYGQAKFVARRLFFDRAMGASFANIFNVGSKSYGIFKLEDQKPRLAYYVIQSLAPIFDGLEPAPDLVFSFKPRGPQTMTPQVAWNAIERHAYRRKGVPLFAWWQPEHLDVEGEPLYGKLVAQSGCDKKDNLPNPIMIDPIRRIVWDVKGAVWSGIPGEDLISLIPATNYPYILTDISIFDEYANSGILLTMEGKVKLADTSTGAISLARQ